MLFILFQRFHHIQHRKIMYHLKVNCLIQFIKQINLKNYLFFSKLYYYQLYRRVHEIFTLQILTDIAIVPLLYIIIIIILYRQHIIRKNGKRR